MPTSIIYARKSTESDDRQVLSIDSQLQELKLLATRGGLVVDEVLTESHSAKAPGRPVFGQLMKRVSRGDITTIICWKMDRLARNHYDTGQVLQALADGKLTKVVTPERTYTADGNDRFLGNFELGIATKFIDDLRSNVKRGNRARFQQGWPNFRPPVGYLEDRTTKTVMKDPERFPLMRRMWDLLLAGATLPKNILRKATDEWGLRTRKTPRQGGKPLSPSMLYRVFQNPYYAGLIRLRSGEVYKGRHEPMVTPQEFERAQAILGRPGRPRPGRHTFAYAGLLRCGGCGGVLTGEVHVKASGRRYVYYRCHSRRRGIDCRERGIPEARFEKRMSAALRKIVVPHEGAQWIVDNLRRTLCQDTAQRQAAHTSLERALRDATTEAENLLTLRLRGQIDDAVFEERRAAIQDRQVKLRFQLDQPEARPDEIIGRLQAIFAFSATASRAFQSEDPVRRRQIVQSVCSNLRVHDQEPLYSAKEPFSFFERAAHRPTWCAIVDDLRTWLVESGGVLPGIEGVPTLLSAEQQPTGALQHAA